jgi:hypothetical protein
VTRLGGFPRTGAFSSRCRNSASTVLLPRCQAPAPARLPMPVVFRCTRRLRRRLRVAVLGGCGSGVARADVVAGAGAAQARELRRGWGGASAVRRASDASPRAMPRPRGLPTVSDHECYTSRQRARSTAAVSGRGTRPGGGQPRGEFLGRYHPAAHRCVCVSGEVERAMAI